MTRQHAALQLLRHGALSLAQLIEITGRTYNCCVKTLCRLRSAGAVRLVKRGIYQAKP